MKIEKEKKFKREYIPVIIAIIIMIVMFAVLVLAIFYEDKNVYEEVPTTNSNTSDLAVDKKDSKCSSKELDELIKISDKITAEYYLKMIPSTAVDDFGDLMEGEQPVIELKVSNLTSDVYIIVKNSLNDETKKYMFEDTTDGVFTFEGVSLDEKVTYTFEVYSNKYDCINEIIRSFSLKTKIYNTYSTMLTCVQYPDFSLCDEFVDQRVSYNTFFAKLDNYKNGKEKEAEKNVQQALIDSGKTEEEKKKEEEKRKEENKTIINKLKENKKLIYISSIIIVSGVAIVILLMFIRRK